MSKYLKAKINDYAGEKGGFITASFFPEGAIEHSNSIEINYSDLPDSFSAPPHYHSHSKTWVVVTKGKMYFKIAGDLLEVGVGEFIIFEAGVEEEVLKVDPGTGSFTIHSPSIPGGDKVMI